MSDQLQDQAPDIVQSSTIKPLKKVRNQHTKYKETHNRGSRLPSWFMANDISDFATKYTDMLKALPKVKTANKPKYDAMFSRKFMVLIYLSAIEIEIGHFSILSIQQHFRQGSSVYATSYFRRLVNEGWIIPTNTHMLKHSEAILSPLFFSLLQTITSFLRREFPDRHPVILSPEIIAIKPNESMLDHIQEITDPR